MAHHCPIATVRTVKRRHKGHIQLQNISPKLVFGFFHPFSVIIFTATVSYIVTANFFVFKYSLQVINVESAAHRLSCYCRGQKNENFSISTFPPKMYEQLFRKCPQSINKWDNGEGTSMSPPPTSLKSIFRSDLVASFVTLKHFHDLLPCLFWQVVLCNVTLFLLLWFHNWVWNHSPPADMGDVAQVRFLCLCVVWDVGCFASNGWCMYLFPNLKV